MLSKKAREIIKEYNLTTVADMYREEYYEIKDRLKTHHLFHAGPITFTEIEKALASKENTVPKKIKEKVTTSEDKYKLVFQFIEKFESWAECEKYCNRVFKILKEEEGDKVHSSYDGEKS